MNRWFSSWRWVSQWQALHWHRYILRILRNYIHFFLAMPLCSIQLSPHPKFPPHISLVVPSLRLGTFLCALITNYEYWIFLLASSACPAGPRAGWQEEKNGVGTSRGKRQIMLCNLIDTHIAVFRYQKVHLRSSQQQRLLRILCGRNPMRWYGSVHVLGSPWHPIPIDSEIIWKLKKPHSNKNSLRYGNCERSSNPGSICSFNDPSSVLERGHWSCTEDYPSLRGSLNSDPWRLQDNWLIYSPGSIDGWTKSQRAAS